MKEFVAFDDAVDLLDADHKAVKKMFMDYNAMCEDLAPADARQALAQRICMALSVHAELEEEIFYPQVRDAIENDEVLDEALDEHAEAEELIEQIKDMDAQEADYDATVIQLGQAIDLHVLKEREEIFLKARLSALDLRGMVIPMLKLQMQLKKTAVANAKEMA